MGSDMLRIILAVLVFFSDCNASIVGFNSSSQRIHVKCIEKERQTLLKFKQGLIDDSGMLSSWSDNDNETNCCRWEGIDCNNETSHIQIIDLHGSKAQYLSGDISITSSLVELQNLEYFDLSYNSFWGSQIPEHMGSFKSLRYLNLSNMALTGRIPSQLGNLSKLEYLDLQQNSLGGAIPSQLGKLASLQYLDLSDNSDMDGEIPSQIGNLSQLRYLDLGYTSLSGAIPFQVGNLPFLHTFKLVGNFDLESNNSKWLSSLSTLTTLSLRSLPNLVSSRHWLQMINELIPNLRELRLVDCSLSDDNISSLFRSSTNISTSLSILDLSDNMLTSSAFQLLFNYSFNLHELYLSRNDIVWSSSQYANFHSLVILDLSHNNLTSSIIQENFNISSKLRELYLVNCGLTDKSFLVPSASIKKSSSSLVTLSVSYNQLKSSAVFYWVFNYTTSLHSLNLYGNLLEGCIPNGFGKTMRSIVVLALGSNKLRGEIPASLGDICTLQVLYLENNNLDGEISSFIQKISLCNRHVFQILYLSNNRFTGVLPDISILTSLRVLDLSNNQLIGEIPKSIGLLQDLEFLSLQGNYLEGEITELHLTGLFKLVGLDLTDNSLSLKFGTNWIPPFQLYNLGLASCKLGPSFPNWLKNQTLLSFLDISDAGIDDLVPEWFWKKLQTISEMNMSHNSLKGTIPNLPIKLIDQTFVILSSNQLEGEIPAFLSQAYTLDLSRNKISDIHTFLCEKSITTRMRTLDLSNNQIMGELPSCWEHMSSLEFLDLSSNKLSGKIPQFMVTLVNLEIFVLRNNRLTEELPFTLKNCTQLSILDVSENLLSGPIPSWIGESLQQLKILSLRENKFFGIIPVHLCNLRQILLLDLSWNHLSGGVPTCLRNFTTMMKKGIITSKIVKKRKITSTATDYAYYDSNVLLMWKGQERVYWNPEIFLKSIDLSSNDLTGKIPKEVGYLLGLVSLNLSRNNLSGEIPSEIGNLNLLEFLDLSRNHFSGRIPSTLSKIDRLTMLDLSNNDLIGRIPWGRQLQTFDATSFEGNDDLCGEQLNKSCPGDKTIANPKGPIVDDEDDNSAFYGALYMSLGFGFFTGFWSLLGSILLWKPWRNAYQRFLNRATDYILLTVEMNVAKFHRWHRG